MRLIKSPFFYCTIILIIMCTIAISGVNTVLLRYLDDFEKSTPTYFIENFTSKLRTGNFQGMMELLGVEGTPMFGEDEYIKYLNDTFYGMPQNIKVFGGKQEGNVFTYQLAIEGKLGIDVQVTQHKGDGKLHLPTYSIKQAPIEFNEMTIFAPQNVTVFANDVQLTDKHLQVDTHPIDEFDSLMDTNLVPKLVSYKIDGYIDAPKITVKDREFKISSNNVISVTAPADIAKEVEEFAETAAVTYAKFVSKDAKFGDFAKYLVKESEYYNSIRGFSNYWYIDHTAPTVLNLKSEDTLQYSNTTFASTVSFDYKVITTKHSFENVIKAKYRMYVIKTDDGYKIANLMLL